PPGATRYFESPAHFVPLGRSLRLPLLLRPISYAFDAFRLRRAKRQFVVALTISNLWRADFLNILSMGTDHKVSICHTNIIGNATNRILLWFLPLVSLVYRRFDRVVSVSRPIGDEIRSLYRLDNAKCCVIHNCVPLRVIEHTEKADQRIRIVWCGRFVAEKNVLVLIEIFAMAFKSNSALQLVLIGDGPLRRQSEALIERLGLKTGISAEDVVSDVVLTGFVPDPLAYIARSDFQVFPSIAEGLGLVLIEGFSVGIPALASDCSGGGVHDAMGGTSAYRRGRIEPEQTGCGFLLPVPELSLPKTIDIWRCHMLLMAENLELRRRLSASAKARARLFSPKVVSPQWLQLLNEIL
ncbi:MAG: glycosyltransferase, partial [Sedimentisphaerales bacterium]|nr:glycosyltransferase [Sedimentisphaerales bacterium]